MLKNVLRSFLLLSLLFGIQINQSFAQNLNYAEALQKSIFFYECQQSGTMPAFNRVNWKGSSGMNDGSDNGKDLKGGWYDAGDNVKFGFPMAFSATMLGWGAIDFKDGYVKSGQLPAIKNNLRFVYDYFIKCHTAPNELYGQVGNGGTDHAFWGAAEIMQMARPSYKIDATHPGTDLAMETASALAAGSILFAQDDPAYSATLLRHAKELYTFGNTFRGKYTDAITDASAYYNSWSGYQDELVWGGIWLFRATGDIAYLNNAETEYDLIKGEDQSNTFKPYKWGLAWDDKSFGCYGLLAKLTGKAKYMADAERHLDYWTDGFNGTRIAYTPGGLAWLTQWGSLRHAANTSFVALYYSDLSTTSPEKKIKYKNFAVSQINYILGANPAKRSYVCGFGVNPPINPHHRTGHGGWTNSLTGPPVNNRHTIYGALVGGPGVDDSYVDDRGDFVKNEVATDYNAGFSGALARLVSDGAAVTLPAIPKEAVGEEYVATIKTNSTGTNYFEPSIKIFNHTAWPARIPSKLSFRYFIDISEGVAKGHTIADYSIVTGFSPGATIATSFKQWSGTIYYVEVTYNNVLIFPGGQSESTRECQLRVVGPSDAWDPTNDFSNAGVVATNDIQTQNVPMYDNGVLVWGKEPSGVVVVNFTINASAGTGGTITPAGAVSVASGGSRAFTITPASGFAINQVLVNGVSVGAVSTFSFTNVTANQTIAASFKAIIVSDSLTITSSAGTGGSISPLGIVKIAGGGSRTFTITPATGFTINAVLVNGVSVGAVSSFAFTNVTANQTIAASFKAIVANDSINIVASAGTGGSITPSGTIRVPSGSSRTFTIAAASGFQIADVVVNGVSRGPVTTVAITGATTNQTITASFSPVVVGGACLLTRFGVPRATPLPTLANAAFTRVYTLGTGGPALSNVTSAVINWDLVNKGLWQLSFNTNNGVPAWWIDMRNNAQTFAQPQPAITFAATGITNLDGNKYYVNVVDANNVVFVEVTGKHAIYFSTSVIPPAGCAAPVATKVAGDLTTVPSLRVFPNPVGGDKTTAEVSDNFANAAAQVQVSTIKGSIVKTYVVKITGTRFNVNTSGLTNGKYVVTISAKGQLPVSTIIDVVK